MLYDAARHVALYTAFVRCTELKLSQEGCLLRLQNTNPLKKGIYLSVRNFQVLVFETRKLFFCCLGALYCSDSILITIASQIQLADWPTGGAVPCPPSPSRWSLSAQQGHT